MGEERLGNDIALAVRVRQRLMEYETKSRRLQDAEDEIYSPVVCSDIYKLISPSRANEDLHRMPILIYAGVPP